ncbi:MAG TPA: hypothetical protein VK610_05715, partial [Rhodothermales bacterium]|nr:hypothetical protein [Rhodothermales bacterium]
TERVQFRRGATSATVNGSAIRGERVRYILGASAGQRMSVTIRSTENNAVFAVGTGEEVAEWPATFTEFTGRLAEDTDYAIDVWGTRGNASYTITFTIR